MYTHFFSSPEKLVQEFKKFTKFKTNHYSQSENKFDTN